MCWIGANDRTLHLICIMPDIATLAKGAKLEKREQQQLYCQYQSFVFTKLFRAVILYSLIEYCNKISINFDLSELSYESAIFLIINVMNMQIL